VLVVTTNDIPGWEIRSRNAFAQIGAGFKSMFGGELQGMTKNLADSRNKAMGRLINEARNRAANAVIGMRFDTTELGDVWMKICAYGTAVQAVPVTDAARYTASQLGYGGAGRPQQVPTGPKVRRDAAERGQESLRVPDDRDRCRLVV
jgi:uncharacterized protein YbjQ (UPF0145 family)